MKQLTIKVYSHEGFPESVWKKRFERANYWSQKEAGVELVFTREEKPFVAPFFDPLRTSNGIKRISYIWFEEMFSKHAKEFDFVVASYTLTQYDPDNTNKGLAESLRDRFGPSEIAISSSKGGTKELAPGVRDDQWAVRLLHEMSHGVFDHLMHAPDVTHDHHLIEILRRWDIPEFTEKEDVKATLQIEPQLMERWEWLREAYKTLYDGYQPVITQTYRNKEDQEKAFKEGKSNAHYGQSLHNYTPCYAVDVAFMKDGAVSWEWEYYRRFGRLAESVGLVWGGSWVLRDGPHIELPMSWTDARDGNVPRLKSLKSHVAYWHIDLVKRFPWAKPAITSLLSH